MLANQYKENPDLIINKGQVHYTPYTHFEVARFILRAKILSYK